MAKEKPSDKKNSGKNNSEKPPEPPDMRSPNAFEAKDGKVCESCKGTGKIKPKGAVREALCQKCKGKGKGWVR